MKRTHQISSHAGLSVGYIERVDSQTVAIKIGGHAMAIFETEAAAIAWAERREFGVVEDEEDYGDIRDTAFDRVAPALYRESGNYHEC